MFADAKRLHCMGSAEEAEGNSGGKEGGRESDPAVSFRRLAENF